MQAPRPPYATIRDTTRKMARLAKKNLKTANRDLPKAPTGIEGLDEITGGGLPRGRPTLVCGSAGCGKTLLAMEFLVRGATQFGEPGVFMAFEETAEELTQNVRSLGFDLDELVEQKKLVVDYVRVERSEIEETGEYDLEGLFVRLGHAIDSIGAKRVVLDTIETLFGGLSNAAILRAELRRLFRWLKDKGVTAVITGERGEGTLTRQGLEEYVSDCVILLDHRVTDQVSTRRLRIVKYRGTVARHQRVPVPDRRGRHLRPADHLAGLAARGQRRADLDAASRGSTPCSAARATTAAAASWSPARRAPARPASPRTSPTRPAGAASAACTSPSRSRRARSSATCARSASTWSRGSRRACCASTPSAPRCTAWRCTWRRSTSWSASSSRAWSSSIRSAA